MARIALCKASGPLADLLQKLSGEKGDVWLQDLNKFLRKEDPLLELLGIVAVPATKKFVAKEHFLINIAHDAPVKISRIGNNFQEWFLGKTEKPTDEVPLCCYRLSRSSVNDPIIDELGGEVKAEITLAEIYSFMEDQRNLKKGALLTNGYANIFYVRDMNGVLRAVQARWCGDGWSVDANFVSYPYGWDGGFRVFSRY